MTVNKYLTTRYWKRRNLHSAPSERELRDNYNDEVFYVIESSDVEWVFEPESDKTFPKIKVKHQTMGHMYYVYLVQLEGDLYFTRSIGSERENRDLLAAGFMKIPKDVLAKETPLTV